MVAVSKAQRVPLMVIAMMAEFVRTRPVMCPVMLKGLFALAISNVDLIRVCAPSRSMDAKRM